MAFYGIDISKHNGNINFDAIPAKYTFAVIRTGYGLNVSQKDALFDANMKGAMKRGLNIGVYWFLYATNVSEAIQNADLFLQVIKPYKGKINLPVYLDVEGDSVRYMKQCGVEPSRSKISEMIRAFCTTIENAGYYAGVYSDNNFINQYFTNDILKSYDLWFAYWVNAFSPAYCTRNCGMWQHTNKGKIEGISGNVDLNYTDRDYPDIIKSKKLNFLTPEQTDTKPAAKKNYVIEESDDKITIRFII